MTTQYIGFTTLENFAHDSNFGPEGDFVNVAAISDAGRFSTHGLCVVHSIVMVSQAWAGNVYYCRIQVSQFQSMDGRTSIGGEVDHGKLAEQALAIVEACLKEDGYTTRRAVVAMPKNLVYLEGHAECLTYDKALGYTKTGEVTA